MRYIKIVSLYPDTSPVLLTGLRPLCGPRYSLRWPSLTGLKCCGSRVDWQHAFTLLFALFLGKIAVALESDQSSLHVPLCPCLVLATCRWLASWCLVFADMSRPLLFSRLFIRLIAVRQWFSCVKPIDRALLPSCLCLLRPDIGSRALL